jgi:hypothetical protein
MFKTPTLRLLRTAIKYATQRSNFDTAYHLIKVAAAVEAGENPAKVILEDIHPDGVKVAAAVIAVAMSTPSIAAINYARSKQEP